MPEEDGFGYPGALLATAETELTLYKAAREITFSNPEYGYALCNYIEDDQRFMMRIGGPAMATVSAMLAAVACLHKALKSYSDDPFAATARRIFAPSTKALLKGSSFESVLEKLSRAGEETFRKYGSAEEAGVVMRPTHPPIYGPDPIPNSARGLTALLHAGCDLSRMQDSSPFMTVFALSDDTGNSWTAFVGGMSLQATMGVLSLFSALQMFVEQQKDEFPDPAEFNRKMLSMVREAWKTEDISYLTEKFLGNTGE